MIKKAVVFSIVFIGIFFAGRFSVPSNEVPAEKSHSAEAHAEETEWTCSMHPQIKLPEKGQCPICFMDLIPLTTGDGADEGERVLSMSESARALAGIETTPVVNGEAVRTVKLFGKIAVDETREEMITSRVAGRIEYLAVDYTGQKVKRGQVIAKLYSPELISLQKELLEAQKALLRAKGSTYESFSQKSFDAAKEKLRLLGFGPKTLTKILENGTIRDKISIRASQSGTVMKKLVEVGTYVKAGTPLFHIADLQKVWTVFYAYESDLPWLKVGQELLFTVEALPGQQFEGTISFIAPQLDEKKRTTEIRVALSNQDEQLKPAMLATGFAEGVLEGEHLLIPKKAPLITGKRAVVYVKVPEKEKPTFEGREIVLGALVNDNYIVYSGIEEGEDVVVNGAFNIDGELQIRAKRSMMNPDGDAVMTGHEGHGMEQHSQKQKEGLVSKPFIQSLEELRDAYFNVGLALAADDYTKAKEEFVTYKKSLLSVKAGTMGVYATWNNMSKRIIAALEHIEHSNDIESLRKQFQPVSEGMIELAKEYTSLSPYNLAYCPMAFGNTGAYWLQKEDVINNPYFGAMMLKCGSIKGSFGKE